MINSMDEFIKCDVVSCDVRARGQEVTTFGNNELITRLCPEHLEIYIQSEDHTHKHVWTDYIYNMN